MDATQFSAEYSELFPKIYSYIAYRISDRQTAEDLTSHTFLKALENIAQFDDSKACLKTWLYHIAQNTLIDHFRSHKPQSNIEAAEKISAEDDVLESILTQENHERVKTLLEKLSAEQRKIVLLRLWDDLSYKEIAELTGKTEAALKMTFMRALSLLRSEYITLLSFFILFLIQIR